MTINKRTILYYLLISFLFSNSLQAQVEIAWEKKYSRAGNEFVHSFDQTSDGGFIILGQNFSNNIILIKTDSLGNEEWSKVYDNRSGARGNTVKETSDSGFVVFGTTSEKTSWLIKTNNSGDTLWTKKYPQKVGHKLMIESNGFVLVGICADTSLIWFAHSNLNGEIDSFKNYHTVLNYWDSLKISIDETKYSIDGYKILVSSPFAQYQMFQIDRSGGLIWQNISDNYAGFWYSALSGFECDENACVSHADSGMVMIGQYGGNLSIMKTVWEGEVSWLKNNYTGNNYSVGKSFVRTKDNGFILTGMEENFYKQILLMQVDYVGNMLWKKTLGSGEGNSILLTDKNEIVICGESNSDIFLMKMSSKPVVEIIGDSNWIDNNWSGEATGKLDGSQSIGASGTNIIDYEWKYDEKVVGTNSLIELTLPTGNNTITLKVTDGNGISNSSDINIQVCSYKLETNGSITSSISTVGDSVFYASSTDDQIYCYDNMNNLKWTLATGGDIQSTTTIGPNGNIYVGSADTRLYCFDPLGNFKWDTPMGGTVSASPAITQERIVYVGTENNRLYSVNGSNGSINWNYLTGGSITASAALSNSGDIYFGSFDKKFYSLNSNGTLNWSYSTNGEIHSSPAIDTTGRIFFGSDDKNLYALNSDGSLSWSFVTEGAVKSSPVIDSEGNIYFGSGDGYFYVVDVNGTEIWKYNTNSPVYGDPSLTRVGNVIFGCDDGYIFSLSKDGELNWSFKTNNEVVAAPLITADGRAYIGSSDNSIYGFLDLGPLSASFTHQWPTFQKDNKRTGSQIEIQTGLRNTKNEEIPNSFNLFQNYPNPFNPTTQIQFHLAELSTIKLDIYNVNGEKVRTIVNAKKEAGIYTVEWNGLNDRAQQVGSGIYLLKLNAIGTKNTFIKTMKMIKLK